MSNDAIANFTASYDRFLAPIAKLNQLVVAQVEELTVLELSSLRAYTDRGLEQVKAAVEVSDTASFKAFAESQNAAVMYIGEKLVADAKEVAKIGNSYRERAMAVTRDAAAELN